MVCAIIDYGITDETGDNDDGVCRLVFFALDDANVDFDRLADASTAPEHDDDNQTWRDHLQ